MKIPVDPKGRALMQMYRVVHQMKRHIMYFIIDGTLFH